MSKNITEEEKIIFDSLIFLPLELVKLIFDYYPTIPNGDYAFQWNTPTGPRSITYDNEFFYIGVYGNSIYRYTSEGQSHDIFASPTDTTRTWSPFNIECSLDNKFLYTVHHCDQPYVMVIEISTHKIISQWDLPCTRSYVFLKIDYDCIFISISQFHQILRYSKDGKEMTYFGKIKGPKEGEFNYPCGLAVNNNFLFICDANNHRIQILDKIDTTFVACWGQKAKGMNLRPCEFNFPFYITREGDLLYISDFIRVQVCDTTGRCIRVIGKTCRGKGEGEFNIPRGVCILNGKLYVCDRENNRIQVFT